MVVRMIATSTTLLIDCYEQEGDLVNCLHGTQVVEARQVHPGLGVMQSSCDLTDTHSQSTGST
jgi:hypothetical protein